MNFHRTIYPVVLIGALSLTLLPVEVIQAQTTTATTVPVGYQQLTVAAATDPSTPVSTVVAVPFYNPAAYAGLVTSVDSASMLSSSAASWTASQFSSSPYFLHFKSGNSVGRYFLITANTTTQLTVANRGYDLTTISAAADTFEILPAFTLGTLFGTGTGTVPFQTGASATVADNVLLWNGSSWDTYYNNGTNWKKSGSLANQNSVILYPDEGMYITRRATTPVTLTFLGTTPSTTERSDLVGPGSTFVANRFPVDTTLVNVGFQSLPNWLNGASASVADNVYIWNGTGWGVYYYNGTNWKKSGSLSNVNTQAITSGTAMFVVRQSTATGTNATLAQALPYSLN